MKNQTIVRAHKTCLLTMQGFRTGSSSQMTLENLALWHFSCDSSIAQALTLIKNFSIYFLILTLCENLLRRQARNFFPAQLLQSKHKGENHTASYYDMNLLHAVDLQKKTPEIQFSIQPSVLRRLKGAVRKETCFYWIPTTGFVCVTLPTVSHTFLLLIFVNFQH